MEKEEIKRWALFFCGILAAIVIAETLSSLLVSLAGFTGGVRFLAGFVLYAAVFFGVVYGIERATGTSFFGFSRRLQ
jgi:hypothetical protein